MGDDHEHVVFYDETSPLEQSQRNILQYRPSRQAEEATYLVELPEQRIDAPRPSTRPARRSTIVNTSQLPDTREAEDQPLEEYVRRNLPSFRKSLTPEDLQHLQAQERERYREGEVVRPATAEDIQRDVMDNKKRKSRDTESEKRETIPKYRDTYQSERFSEPKTHELKNPNKFKDSQSSKVEKKKWKFDKNDHDLRLPRNEVVVMPALEPISVSHKSPFDKYPKSLPQNDRLFSPVKVKVSVESSDEEKKQKGKHHSKKGKSEPSSAKRRSTKESNEDSVDEDRNKKRHKKYKHRQMSETPTYDSVESNDQNEKSRRKRKLKERSEEARRGRNASRESSRSSDEEYRKRKYIGKAIHTRSSSVCLSGESEGNSSEPYMVNNPQTRDKRTSNKSSNKSRPPSTKDRTTGEKSLGRSPQSSAKRGRKSEDSVGYNQRTNPFGKQDPYSVHFVEAKKNPDKSKEKKRTDSGEKTGGDKAMAKAPRSATKVVAKRRYHIQIPEHGRPETWFNVRFNMNAQNNVAMNYDGPVKINNYYASNNYS